MISFEVYRAKIWSYMSQTRRIQGINKFCWNANCSKFILICQLAPAFFKDVGVTILELILTLNLNCSTLMLLKLLTYGDVESNSEPSF